MPLLVAVLVLVGRRVEMRARSGRDDAVIRSRCRRGARRRAILAADLAAAYVVSGRNEWDPYLDLLTAWMPRAQIVHSTHSLDPSCGNRS